MRLSAFHGGFEFLSVGRPVSGQWHFGVCDATVGTETRTRCPQLRRCGSDLRLIRRPSWSAINTVSRLGLASAQATRPGG